MVELHTAERKEMEKANDTTTVQEPVSSSRPINEHKIPEQVGLHLSSDSTSSLPPSTNIAHDINPMDLYQKQVQEQFLYYQRNTYGYNSYSGYDGAYSDWKNNTYFLPNEGYPGHYSPQALKPSTQSGGNSMGYYPIENSYSYLNQGRGQFPRNMSTNDRRLGRSRDDSSTRENFNQRRYSEGINERICGPRADKKKTLNSLNEKEASSCSIDQSKYNLPDFQSNYGHAKFYMIKSYNEDDVHKSIKYSVWASTPGGNKRLNDAFQEAENIAKQHSTKCPVFLFFSVNTSGKYLGVAEMLGSVDFQKSMDFWQEERWSGFFPLKWHIIKDVPNANFRSIILQNNDNRPVYFSRDTQEIPLPQGLKMLEIFKNYDADMSILDDFGFYDGREKSLRARRSCIPSLVPPSEEETDKDFDHLDHLESAMREMQLSSTPSNTASDITSALGAPKKPQY